MWVLFALYDFITFKFTWIIIVVIALALTGSNLWGYFMCSRSDQGAVKAAERAKSWAAGAALSAAARSPGFFTSVLGSVTGGAGAAAAAESRGDIV